MQFEFLSKINSPKDIRGYSNDELLELCKEIRSYTIDTITEIGGHLAPTLGVVELSVALHHVFDTPKDKLVWDVGHQGYAHKLLTGRFNDFKTIRKFNGLSGFLKRSESEYDVIGAGHASTSISAALGIAEARRQKREDYRVAAIIGDGSMTGGLAFEGINNAGHLGKQFLVILNDNEMSISPNVGAISRYFTRLISNPLYNRIRNEFWDITGKLPIARSKTRTLIKKIEESLKSLIVPGILFDELGFRYFGPIDGHNTEHLTQILKDLKNIPGPKILHCITEKGKGYEFSEKGDATKWHAPGLFNKETGKSVGGQATASPPKYQDVFGETIIELANKNDKIVGVTPAMLTGSSLNKMMAVMPERTYDVGIAEQHAVTFSAGLATQGIIPFCNIYSTFLQRAYDQVIHDVAIQNLNVIFCLDRGGLVGADGATHHGVFDISYLRCVPNLIVTAPMDEFDLRNLMYTAQKKPLGPFSIRYPRGKGVNIDWKNKLKEIKIGKGETINEGDKIAVLSIGHPGNFVKKASEIIGKKGVNIGHYNMIFIKPLDEKLLHKIFKKYDEIITIEDGALQGGFGSSILEFASDNNYKNNISRLGIKDEFIHHGTQDELWKECGIDTDAIVKQVELVIKRNRVSQAG